MPLLLQRNYDIAPGNPGNLATAAMMWGFILFRGGDYAQGPNPRVRGIAEQLIYTAAQGGQRPGRLLQAGLIYRWVQEHMLYIGDHLTFEELHDTDYILNLIAAYGRMQGDCDDYVILMGALLASVGIPFDITLTSARADRVYDHVWLIAEMESGQRVPMDAITQQPFGWMVPGQAITSGTIVEMPIQYR